jgi:hypothetical protein
VGAGQPPAPCLVSARPVRHEHGHADRHHHEQRQRSLLWVGPDDRGIELEVIAAVLPDMVLVIHVMPTALRS